MKLIDHWCCLMISCGFKNIEKHHEWPYIVVHWSDFLLPAFLPTKIPKRLKRCDKHLKNINRSSNRTRFMLGHGRNAVINDNQTFPVQSMPYIKNLLIMNPLHNAPISRSYIIMHWSDLSWQIFHWSDFFMLYL